MNIVIYNKQTKDIIDILDASTTFPKGLTNPENSYGLFDNVEGKEKITDEGVIEILPTETKDIIKSIFSEIESDQPTVIKMMSVLNKYPAFITCLDTDNWALARIQMNDALTAGDITQDEYDLINGRIPTE